MTKKQANTKKDKGSAKSAKKAPASKKAKPVKALKKAVKSAPSKLVKPVKKAIVVSKKEANKKADKKTVKVVKPTVAVKNVKVTATKKAEKVVKKVVVETKKVKEVVAKKEKAVDKKQLAPIGKKAKKEKPEKAKKKKKGDDDDDDAPEIVDLWETVEEDEEIEVEGAVKPTKTSKGGRKPKNANDDDEPIIENDILIEQLINSTKKLRKPSIKVPQQIRTFVNPHASLTVPQSVDSKKGAAKKEPKGKFEVEYVVRTSASILYEFLTSPSGLSEWFADNVNIHDGIFTFFWDGSEQKARLLGFKEDKFIRMQWLDKPEGSYFEFRIERDELTGDVSLIITDFADEGSDLQTSKLLWDSQVHKLSQVIGSY